MTNLELFTALGGINTENLAGAEDLQNKPSVRRSRKMNMKRAVLIAAVIAALLLLVGCGYVVLSESQWLQSFFSRQKGQPLSQGQSAYIEQNTQVIGKSVTVNSYTVTV